MGLNNFQIVFEKPMPTYFPGENINGQLIVDLNSEKKMEKIKVMFKGIGKVRWFEDRTVQSQGENGTYSETVRDEFWAEEEYFSMENDIYYGPSLPAGVHNFPFSFPLPLNIPSSYESHIGHIRYEAKGQIVRNWKWDHRVRRIITVNGILDLNLVPECRQPGLRQDHKTLCCLCCASGPISAIIRTARTGYVPGELIGFQAEMDNKSSREMKGTKLELLEHVRYMTPERSKTESRVVAQINRGSMGPGESDTWQGEDMRIPPVPPTNLGGNCSIITVNYSLDFHVIPSGMSMDLVVRLPITIGNIPLQDYFGNFAAPMYQAGFQPAAPSPGPWMVPPPIDQFNAYPNLPPPAYGASAWGMYNVIDTQDQYLGGDQDFLPQYTMYKTKSQEDLNKSSSSSSSSSDSD